MVTTFATFQELKTALATLGPNGLLPAVELTPALAQDILNHDPVNRALRPGRVAQLAREIVGGFWDPRVSSPMGFLETGPLADGQHRCQAVLLAQRSIVVMMRVVPSTVGMDEGIGRTLADQLHLQANLTDRRERELAAAVTKALCRTPNASNRLYLEYFDAHHGFIMECVRKPLAWLADKEVSVAALFKPSLLAVTRAKEIAVFEESPEAVDELLEDIVNAGATAPAGSPRREYAEQVWTQTHNAYSKQGTTTKDFIKWTRGALKYKREGVMKNAITARFPGAASKRKKAA